MLHYWLKQWNQAKQNYSHEIHCFNRSDESFIPLYSLLVENLISLGNNGNLCVLRFAYICLYMHKMSLEGHIMELWPLVSPGVKWLVGRAGFWILCVCYLFSNCFLNQTLLKRSWLKVRKFLPSQVSLFTSVFNAY